MSDLGCASAENQPSARQPEHWATADAWGWLELFPGDNERRARIAERLREIDRLLLELEAEL